MNDSAVRQLELYLQLLESLQTGSALMTMFLFFMSVLFVSL